MASFSFFLILSSSVLSVFSEANIEQRGLIWLIINCCATSVYVLHLKASLMRVKLKNFDTVFYNNLMSIPICLALSVVFDNWGRFME